MSKNFRVHERKDRIKWAIVAVALLLVAVILCGIMTSWFKDMNPYCWFGHDYGADNKCVRCGAEKLDGIQTANGGLYATVASESYGMKLATRRAANNASDSATTNSWTLTASVNDSATDKTVDWSVRWKNGEPTGSADKVVTNYVTVSPTSDGALTATVTCIKPFGKAIEVVVTSRSNPEQSAVCQFDYIKKITGITVNMPNIASTSVAFTYDVQLSEGTVEPTISVSVGEMLLTNEFVTKFVQKLVALPGADVQTDGDDIGIGYALLSVSGNNLVLYKSQDLSSLVDWVGTGSPLVEDYVIRPAGYTYATHPLAGCFVAYTSSTIQNEVPDGATGLTNAFRQTVQSISGTHAHFPLTGTASYGENDEYEFSFATTVNVRFDGSALTIPVSSLTLDNTHIYA